MKNTNWIIKVIFAIYLVIAFLLGTFLSIKAVIRNSSDQEATKATSGLVSEYKTESQTVANSYDNQSSTSSTIKAKDTTSTTAATVTSETTGDAVTSEALSEGASYIAADGSVQYVTSANQEGNGTQEVTSEATTQEATTQEQTTEAVTQEATTEAPTQEVTTAVATQEATTAATKASYVAYTFANGSFKDKSATYTYKVVNADYVNLHTNSDGSGNLTVIPRNTTGKVVAIGAYHTKIEYNGYTGYIFNTYIELH